MTPISVEVYDFKERNENLLANEMENAISVPKRPNLCQVLIFMYPGTAGFLKISYKFR